jgi:UDP-glucose:(heptosyl)LPS alpha-1,3-glucosyltransferase
LLSVAGRDDATRYQGLAARLGVQNRVRFLGAVDDVRGLYAAADVLAHPTWYDPCSRVVLEALCCGLPVVTTWFNGAAEVIEPGRHGVVVDSPDQIDRLSAAVTTCLRSDMRSACAADAARMRERLSMARHARELLELYTSAVRGAGSGGR